MEEAIVSITETQWIEYFKTWNLVHYEKETKNGTINKSNYINVKRPPNRLHSEEDLTEIEQKEY